MRPSESLHHLDVQDVGYEEPEPEVWFDSKRDILPSDIEGMHKLLRASKNWGDTWYWYHGRFAANIIQLDPSFNMSSKILEQAREGLRASREKLRNEKTPNTWWQFAVETDVLKRIDPTFRTEEEITPRDRRNMRKFLQTSRNDANGARWRNFALLASTMGRIIPDFNLETEITAADRENIRLELPKSRGLSDSDLWQEFAHVASIIHDIDPTFDLASEITAADWRGMLAKLQKLRMEQSWDGFASLACALNNLSRGLAAASRTPIAKPFPTIKTY